MVSSVEPSPSSPPSVVGAPVVGQSSLASGQRPSRHRLPLSGSSPRRVSFERRIRLWLAALAAPLLMLSAAVAFNETHSLVSAAVTVAVLALLWTSAVSFLFEQLMRPLQTLSNVVAALREDDFSFRARGARRGDSLGDLALEINALASTLQQQRSAARDALSLVELVMTSMQSPVFAFDASARLHLLNPAAERALHLRREQALGRTAHELHLDSLLALPDHGLYELPSTPPARSDEPLANTRWSVRRTTFRLHGIPHSLFVLADVAIALREEERLAWQRLIRVLGHEINNSLTPIKSIAGTLRSRLPLLLHQAGTLHPVDRPSVEPEAIEGTLPNAPLRDFDRGLAVIEDRADSLNRFLQAYQRLSRLPAPVLSPTPLEPLLIRIIQLETRLRVHLAGGPPTALLADPDQLQQLLINLIRNAADAALTVPRSATERNPEVVIEWSGGPHHAAIRILDNGPGLASTANLFVPFYTTKVGGTGIGLALAQQIATAHRGTVTLRNRSTPPGCEAEVRLPILP